MASNIPTSFLEDVKGSNTNIPATGTTQVPVRPTTIQFSSTPTSTSTLPSNLLKFIQETASSSADFLSDLTPTRDLTTVQQQQQAAVAQQLSSQIRFELQQPPTPGGLWLVRVTPSDGANNNHNFLFSHQVSQNFFCLDGKGGVGTPVVDHVDTQSAAAQLAAVAANQSLLNELGQHLKISSVSDNPNCVDMQDPVISTTAQLPESAPSVEDDDAEILTRPPSVSSSNSHQGNRNNNNDNHGRPRTKLEQKRARNRDAARRCRERKIQLIDKLEKHVTELSTTNKQLQKQLTDTKEEVERLKRFMKQHMDSPSCPVRSQS